MPSITSASTPERISFLPSASVGAKQMTFAPDALIASRLPLGGRPPASTTWPTPCLAQTSINSNNCGCMVIRLTPKGLVASALVAAISPSSNSGVMAPQAMTPNPPALLIALTRFRSETQLIAPHKIAYSLPRSAVPRAIRSLIFVMATPLPALRLARNPWRRDARKCGGAAAFRLGARTEPFGAESKSIIVN